MGKIILFGSQKGGCGKSTLAVNVAGWLISRGEDVILVDADPQGSSERWAQDRQENPELSNIPHVQASGNINQTLRDLAQKYDYVLADTAGRDSRELRTGMVVADILLSPSRPSQYDLDTLPHLAEVFIQAQDLNPTLKGYLVLNMCPTNPVIKEAEDARTYLNEFPEFSMANSMVYDRKAFRDCISEGRTVFEWKDAKAKQEIEALMEEVFHG
ncbi:cobyrinic acid ac-diamide synthase [Veronia nyctiphanis]|uniref:Cobyrinic acid ac-diamide synthase n=1 Tax=Veronia nyctiphanis TaxID=1278244 RepID=A0A4Q0YNN4_9GAMM|nr:AAA family ATPase [Veronia nyctiphanis]RXJ72081.1 cobyrinic acid ac-diamide synthase [Veronia nyctiphanis]RXJ72083.1 cobyrinic acid ac-diamide synthase [Veronia nyctiphanis]